MRITVRGTRGYLAGFGTSGSLLAGAAVLFVLGSAIVAFRGWPQIATGPATTAVAAAQPTAPSRAARRLAAALDGHTTGRITSRVRVVGRRRAARTRGGSVAGGGRPSGFATPGSSASGRGSAGGTLAACSGGCTQPASHNVITGLTSTVAQEVSDIGAGVGSQIQQSSGAVAGTVGGVSPQAGTAVQTGGNAAGGTVSGTAGAVGNSVAQAGNTLGGGGH